MENNNYWVCRIDDKVTSFIWKELKEGRLRQGWGWDEGQNLKNFKKDEGAARNKPMLNVKKGDILLVPHLPEWNYVAIVEATEDWDIGYKFEISKETGDHGHIFPARYIKKFVRDNKHVTGNLRAILKIMLRFCDAYRCREDIEELLKTDEKDLLGEQNRKDRFETSIEDVFYEMFNIKGFSENIYKKFNEQFAREEWEFALVHGLKKIFPFYDIERVGGRKESEHGTDILIKMSGIIAGSKYAIAIQVKDYGSPVTNEDVKNAIKQISKADEYEAWKNENIKIVEKIIIIIRPNEIGISLRENTSNVKVIAAKELEEILCNIALEFLGIKPSY
jgi:hypothetical protein